MKKLLKKSTIVVAALAVLFCCLQPLTVKAAVDPEPAVSDNENRQNYYRWADPVTSYLTPSGDGYLRVEYMEDNDGEEQILLESYDASLIRQSVRTLACELPYFGGFYAGKDAYFLVFGQSNLEQDDSREVIRVVKYDKNWNRLGAASLYGANTYIPFDAGSLRMAEYGDYLYIRTCHEMYAGESGVHHQANLTLEVRISDMKVLDSFYTVWNLGAGYVSHSFNQFLLVDDEANLVALDHGDAYPRCAVLGTYEKAAGNDSFSGGYMSARVWEFQGETGDNSTGASLGGLEYSGTHYLTAGNSVVQDEDWSSHSVRNVFVAATEKKLRSGASTEPHWITGYGENDGISASTPQLVKLDSDAFLLLWAQLAGGSPNGKISYVFLDGAGNKTSAIYTKEGALSDCKPILSGDHVIWYVTDGKKLTFYQVKKDGSFRREVGHLHTYEPTMKFGKTEMSCGLKEGTAVNALTTNTDGEITYSSSDPSIATVDAKSGKVTLKGLGSCTITASAAAGVHYKAKTLSYKLHVLDLKEQVITTAGESFSKTYGDSKFSLKAKCKGGAKLTYASDNTGVAVVSSSGEVTVKGAGTAQLTIQAAATSEYMRGEKKVTLKVAPKSILKCRLVFTKVGDISSDYDEFSKYRAVMDGDKLLKEGVDYTFRGSSWTYSGNRMYDLTQAVGGCGNYSGSGDLSACPIRAKTELKSAVRTSQGIRLTWERESGAAGFCIYRKTGSGSYALLKKIPSGNTVSYTDSTATSTKVSYTYYVKAYTLNRSGNVYAKASKELTVAAQSKLANSITASSVTRSYSSKAQTFSLKVKQKGTGKIIYSSNQKNVKVNSAGKVTIGAKFVGRALITVKAAETAKYKAATKQITITVNPPKTELSSAANQSGKKMKAAWKKNAKATGYQLQYSTDKNFRKGVKTVTIKKNSTVSTVISGLSKGKTYYVRIRPYKTVSKTNVYAGWSKAKKVKIQK